MSGKGKPEKDEIAECCQPKIVRFLPGIQVFYSLNLYIQISTQNRVRFHNKKKEQSQSNFFPAQKNVTVQTLKTMYQTVTKEYKGNTGNKGNCSGRNRGRGDSSGRKRWTDCNRQTQVGQLPDQNIHSSNQYKAYS